MPDTIRRQIQLAVVAALQPIPGLTGGVELGRDTEPSEIPALSVLDQGDTAIAEDVYHARRRMQLLIAADVEGDAGDGAAAAMDALLAEMITRLMADPQWGGLASNTDLGDLIVDPPSGAEVRALTFGVQLLVEYAHRRNDPTAL